MGLPSQIVVFTTVPGGDYPLNAETLAALLGGGGGGGGEIISTPITTVGNGTLTAAALVGGLVVRSGPTAAYTDTTDTAANIVSALSGTQFLSGETFFVHIKNTTSFVQTLSAGANVTLPGTILVPPLSVGVYFGTVGGTAAAPTVTFSHLATEAIHISSQLTNEKTTALTTVGAGTILALGINGGVTTRGGTQVGAFADTTDSIANMLAGVTALSNIVGASVEWTYVNNTTFPATITGATNVTISGMTVIPANSWVKYLVTYVSATSFTFVAIASGYFPSVGTVTANAATPVAVANAAVTAGSNIVLTYKSGTVGATGAFVESSTPGTGFSIKSVASDTAIYNYEIRG